LYLHQLKLLNYKNYANIKLGFKNDFVVLTGENGAGKTNLLDAVYQLSFCKSNFQHRDVLLVKQEEDFFRIEGHYRYNEEEHKTVIKFSNSSKKITEYDGKSIDKMSDHVGRIPLIFIGPRDIQLIFDGSSERRRFIDTGISMPSYQIEEDLLKSYDMQLIDPATKLFETRNFFIKQFSVLFSEVYKSISGDKENVSCDYKSQLTESNKDLGILLAESRDKDLVLQRTTHGIKNIFIVNEACHVACYSKRNYFIANSVTR